MQGGLSDRYNRKIDYLRISVTDRCNLRCVYCMPESGIINRPHDELLSFEEIAKIVKVAAGLGIDKVRLTGGEPLVKKGLADLIGLLNNIAGVKEVSITTNGALLKKFASELKEAGLKRLNISLDSLRQDRYKAISRGGDIRDVLEGIRISLKLGFYPLKVNCLLLDDISEDEIVDFLRLTLENDLCVRFLEFMPVNSFYEVKNFISGGWVLEIARRFGEIKKIEVLGNGPAQTYTFKGAVGSFGIITPISDKFCTGCNRLRLAADGFLRPCLHSDLGVNLRQPLRRGASEKELARLIRLSVYMKPQEHFLGFKSERSFEYSMCQIGG